MVELHPSPPPLRVGLVGLGRHGRSYLLGALHASAATELVAVCGRDPERTRAFALDAGGVAAYVDLEQMLGDSALDALVIASPNDLHSGQVETAAAAGVHVLCEKPLATTVEGCERAVAASQAAGTVLAVGFHLRHNPAHVTARDICRSGELGEVVHAEVRYLHGSAGEGGRARPAWRLDPARAGGGQFVGTGVHGADLVRFLLGEVCSVRAVLGGRDEHGREVVADTSLTLVDGAVASVLCGRVAHPDNAVVVHGERGTLVLAGSVGNEGGGRVEVRGDRPRVLNHARSDNYLAEVEDFASAVRTGVRPRADGVDGLRAAQITAAVHASHETHRSIALDPSIGDAA